MVAATALIAGTLAPALAVMRDAMAVSRESSRRGLLANYAVALLEIATSQTIQNWPLGTYVGNIAGDAALRYEFVWSDAPASGGIVDRLMNIRVTVYDDSNGNSAHDASELSVRFRTKVAKLMTYQNEPN